MADRLAAIEELTQHADPAADPEIWWDIRESDAELTAFLAGLRAAWNSLLA